MKLQLILSVITILLFLSSCNVEDNDKKLLSEKEMVSILTDMEIAEAYASASGNMTTQQRREIGERVLMAHNVKRSELDSTLSWYGKNADLYYTLLQKVDKNIEKKQRNIAKNDADLSEKSDNSDLWTGLRGVRISENTLKRGIVFDIKNPALEKGDKLEWSMRILSQLNCDALLGVDYADGTSHIQRSFRQGDRRFNIHLQTDSSKTVKRIFGYMRENNIENLPVWCDSIRLLRMPLDSMSYYEISQQRFLNIPGRRIAGKKDSVSEANVANTTFRESANNNVSGTLRISGSQGRSDISPARLLDKEPINSGKVETGMQRKAGNAMKNR